MHRRPGLKVDVAVMPHHGSEITLDKDFLKALEPKIIIVSCGEKNHSRLKVKPGTDSNVFVTSRHGAITITVSSDGKVSTETFLKTAQKDSPD